MIAILFGVYFIIGILFALAIVGFSFSKIDAVTPSVGARIILVPSLIFLWPRFLFSLYRPKATKKYARVPSIIRLNSFIRKVHLLWWSAMFFVILSYFLFVL